MAEDKLTNQEIVKIFAMYWDSQFTESPTANITGGGPAGYIPWLVMDAAGAEVDLSTYKLLLTDLKDITDEHANDVVKVLRIDEKEAGYDTNGAAIKNCLAKDGYYALSLFDFYGTGADTYQYLISKGYAVPIFISLGHPLNGKTPIELGVAIKKI